VAAAADTEEKTAELMRDATEFYLEGLKEDNSGLCNQNSRP
jgi:predicted RNase H-like HicB family nuclease